MTSLNLSYEHPYSSLQGVWEFENDNSTTVFDFSGNSWRGSFSGNAYSSNSFLYLDGSGDWVNAGSILNRNSSTSPFSVCVKFNLNQPAADGEYGALVGKWIPSTGGRSFLLTQDSGNQSYTFIYSTNGADTSRIFTNTVPIDNENYILCGVYNGTNLSLYLDGILEASANVSAIYNSTSGFIIGAFNNSGEFNGIIDWVLYFNNSLNSTDISKISTNLSKQFVNSGEIYLQSAKREIGDININLSGFYFPKGTSAFLKFDGWNYSLGYNESYLDFFGHWHFDSSFNDSSKNNFQSLIKGNANLSSGYFNNSLNLNGIGDYIEINDFNETYINRSMSFSAKVYLRSVPTEGVVGIIGSTYGGVSGTSTDYNWLLRLDTEGKLDLRIWNATAGGSVVSVGNIPLNTWTNIGVTYNGSSRNVVFYFNGEPEPAQISNFNRLYNGGDFGLQIGTYKYRTYANGTIDNRSINASLDEVILFNTTLSDSDMNAIHGDNQVNWIETENTMEISDGETVTSGYSFYEVIKPKLILNSDANNISTPSLLGSLSLFFNQQLKINVLNNNSTLFYLNRSIYNITTNGVVSDKCWLSADSNPNISMDKNSPTEYGYVHEGISYGTHLINFYCNDTEGIIVNTSYSFNFTKNISLVDEFFTNSQGLNLFYDVYFDGETYNKGNIVIITDTWTSDKSGRVSQARFFGNNGYLTVLLNTRGKGYSEGKKDAFGYECLDIYETVEKVKSKYSIYLNDTNSYIWGFSAGGGKAIVCSSKYPDYFSAAFSNSGVVNITKWYETAASQADKDSMKKRTGFTPSENIEAYNSRDGTFLASNLLIPVMAMHGNADPRVNVSLGRNLNLSLNSYGKTYNYSEFAGIHTVPSHATIWSLSWFNTYKTPATIPPSGNFKIGGFLVNKNFSVKFIDDVGKYGTVNYSLNEEKWELNISTETYTERANITLNSLPFDDYIIYDNDINITTVLNNEIISKNSSYDTYLSEEKLEFTLPHMSEHNLVIDKIIDLPPTINITSPGNNSNLTFSGSVSVTLNVDAEDDYGIQSYWYNIDGGNNVSFNQVAVIPFSLTQGESESYMIYAFVNDSSGNINSSLVYVTLTREAEQEDEDSGSSGGGSSGGYTPSEKTTNIILKNILANQEKTSPLNIPGIYLTNISILANKNIPSSSIKIQTKNIENNSNLFLGLKLENIFQSFEINKTGIVDEDINKVSFNFKINNSWLINKNTSQIVLQRKKNNSNSWENLKTDFERKDINYSYFKSLSPGFSLFAIYYNETKAGIQEIQEENETQFIPEETIDTVKNFFSGEIIFYSIVVIVLLSILIVTFILIKRLMKKDPKK